MKDYALRTAFNAEVTVAAADGAQTNLAISDAIDAKSRLEVFEISVTADGDNSVNVAVRIGFGTATLPAAALTPVKKIIASHPDLSAGSGFFGHPGVGAAGEELRLTCDAPTGGNLVITYVGRIIPN